MIEVKGAAERGVLIGVSQSCLFSPAHDFRFIESRPILGLRERGGFTTSIEVGRQDVFTCTRCVGYRVVRRPQVDAWDEGDG